MAQTIDEHAFQLSIMNSLKDANMKETLTSQMRLKLIEKLNKGKMLPGLSTPGSKTILSLTDKITASLILQFLKQKGFNMTLSIFEPEVGENLFLEESQILELMVRGTESYKAKIKSHLQNPYTSVLDFIISSHFKGQIGSIDSCTQTFNSHESLFLDEKLSNLESFHLRKTASLSTPPQSLENYRQTLQSQYKKDLDLELHRIRTIEISQAKETERLKFTERYEKTRQDMDTTLALRYQEIRKKESVMQTEITAKIAMIDCKFHQERENLRILKEESALKADIVRRELDIERVRVESIGKGVFGRESELNRREREIDSKFNSFDEKMRIGVDRARDEEMGGIRVERELLGKKLRMIESELREVGELRGTVEKLSARNGEISDELSKGRKELVETKGRNRQLEKDHGELRENWRVMNEHTRRREMELEKLEIRAKNYVIENDQIRIMNEELKQMIDMRKVET